MLVLLVSGNAADAFLFERALKTIEPALTWRRVSDGQQAQDYLRGAGAYADRAHNPLPSVMICDLHLARVGVADLVDWVRAQPDLAQIRCCVFSTSDESGLENVTDCVFMKPETADDWGPVLTKMIWGEPVEEVQ
jgi:CheY-like chemotaxis protein